MKQLSDKIDLIHTIKRVTLTLYGIVIICFALFYIYDKVSFLKTESEKIRNIYTSDQKLQIKVQVKSAVQLIRLAYSSNISEDDILESLKNIRFDFSDDSYIFVNTYNGIPLLFNAERVIDGKSIWELTDSNGLKVIQEERNVVRDPEGGFMYYSWLKPSTNSISPKVSFVKGVPELDWMVGSGVYLDSIEKKIIALQKQIIKDTVAEASVLFVIAGLILFVIQFYFSRFTKTVENEIGLFFHYFNDAAIDSKEINISDIRYREFSYIAEGMNQMVNVKLESDALRLTSEKRLRLQREQSPLGYVEWDLDSKIIDWNLSAERIFGFSREEIIGSGFEVLLSSVVIPDIVGVFTGLANAIGGTKNINENITKDGRTITCEWYNKILTNQNGELLSYVSLVDDISERKRMEDSLAKSLEEKQILLKEVHHRVKNNMAIITSLISLQSMNIEDKNVQGLLQSTENRVRSMSLIHEYLYKSDNLKDISVKMYIDELIIILLESYNFSTNDISTQIEIVSFDLDLDLLIPLGMIINEIVSNSLKHAFKNIDSPKLYVSFMKDSSGKIILTVKDNGIGLPSDNVIKEKDTLGFLLINSLVDQIYASMEIKRSNGTKYTIIVPE